MDKFMNVPPFYTQVPSGYRVLPAWRYTCDPALFNMKVQSTTTTTETAYGGYIAWHKQAPSFDRSDSIRQVVCTAVEYNSFTTRVVIIKEKSYSNANTTLKIKLYMCHNQKYILFLDFCMIAKK
jgi:hypothetical protein